MEIFIAILIIIAFVCLTRQKPDDNKTTIDKIMNVVKKENYPYSELRNGIIEMLKGMGCEPSINDDEDIYFVYQDENLLITIGSSLLITIYDIGWADFKEDDPNLCNMKEAINIANMNRTVSIVYTKNDEGIIIVHSKYTMLLNVDDNKKPILNAELFSALFRDFFRAHKDVSEIFSKLNIEKH
jgi:hypothetical protein